MWMFQEEMEDVLCFHYGLSATDARACLASCRPDLLREFLELHLIDRHEYVVKEKLSTCSPEKFAPTKEGLNGKQNLTARIARV